MKNHNPYRPVIFAKLAPAAFLLLILLIAVSRSCFTVHVDPIDNSINKTRQIVETFDVVDSVRNGFRITYATARNVTDDRLQEIRSRIPIQKAFRRLKHEAHAHFQNNMLSTDIYDFAGFARQYDVDHDITIHCIFITGLQKIALYESPNPAIRNCASWINPSTEQGVLWINHDDIYFSYIPAHRKYRYWKCNSIYSTSSVDEHFIHFSEDERIY